ncbi:hypothetical protein B0H10DRAFT_2162199 [Mycena sp. CBHHK59/15]|nr:hypothetical protein B0H10DRAFT_2162199 [Mycena sp. CBHHK59/15]
MCLGTAALQHFFGTAYTSLGPIDDPALQTCPSSELLKHNAKVYIAGRSRAKFDQEAKFLELDLGSLQSVKNAAEEYLSKETELHILGQMLPSIDQLNVDGYDLQFGTNIVGHFYFTKQLLPALIVGAKASPDGRARVVNTSSVAHYMGSLDFGTFNDSSKRKTLSKAKLSSQSKLGNVVFSSELGKRYGHQGIVSTALNPGHIRTSWQNNVPKYQAAMVDFILHEPHFGSLTLLWGTSPETKDYNGQFLIPWARLGQAKPGADDDKLGVELWAWLEDQIKDFNTRGSGVIKAKL